jgi:enamine deaminase RidA (YjgF/YER057c/UK114 family)
MKKIFTLNAPEAAGHYSQAIVHQGLVFVSGQLPLDPVTRKWWMEALNPRCVKRLKM